MMTPLEDFGVIGNGETSHWCSDPELPAILHCHRLSRMTSAPKRTAKG
jgi:hypothetical protein